MLLFTLYSLFFSTTKFLNCSQSSTSSLAGTIPLALRICRAITLALILPLSPLLSSRKALAIVRRRKRSIFSPTITDAILMFLVLFSRLPTTGRTPKRPSNLTRPYRIRFIAVNYYRQIIFTT